MPALRARNAALLAKIETTEGTDASPSGTTDGILCENLQINPDVKLTQTNEVTGSLDNRAPIPGGSSLGISFDVYLRGSGSAATPPEFGKLLTACGFKEIITASAVPASAAAATAGSATTLTLGGAVSTTAQAYRGMPILLAVNPAGGATPFVIDYTTGKLATLTDSFTPALDTTTTAQVPANVLYKPTSDATEIKSITFYAYMDGVLYKVLGARGNASLSMKTGEACKISFNFTGMDGGISDASVPTPNYQNATPIIFKGGVMTIDRLVAAVSELRFESGNNLVYPANPNAAQGFDPTIITNRDMTGTVDPLMTLVATRNIFNDFKNGTARIMHARCGQGAGNRFSFTAPSAQYTGSNPGDRDGLLITNAPFKCVGQDAGAFLCFY